MRETNGGWMCGVMIHALLLHEAQPPEINCMARSTSRKRTHMAGRRRNTAIQQKIPTERRCPKQGNESQHNRVRILPPTHTTKNLQLRTVRQHPGLHGKHTHHASYG